MIANKINKLSPFMVMEVLEKAQEMTRNGIDVIHLEVGEPDFDIPEIVKDAAIQALQSGRTSYTHSLGDEQLRKAICKHYQIEYGVHILPEQVLVTMGTSTAISLVLNLLLNPNDEVIISDPGYACYENFIRVAGGKAVKQKVYEKNGFQYESESLKTKINERTKAIMINSPMNPTGQLISEQNLAELSKLSPYIISDEIYHGLTYGQKARSILEFTRDAFVLNGFSKRYAMTGLRLGFLIAPLEHIRNLQILQQNLFICADSVSQHAGIAALEHAADAAESMRQVYDKRRMYLIERLRQIGFRIEVEPRGAFYVFVDAKHLNPNSYKLAFDILEKAHVGVTPGIDFGENGEGYLRFSYANSIENICEGMDRLSVYVKNYH